VREEVRDDAVLARFFGQAGRGPFLPGRREVGQEPRVVHGEECVVVVRNGGDLRCLGFEQCRADGLDAGSRFGCWRCDSDPHLTSRVVGEAAFVPYERHRESHRATLTGRGGESPPLVSCVSCADRLSAREGEV
jgi:hypothetical protein